MAELIMLTVWVPGRPRTKGSLSPQQRHDAAGRLVTRRTAGGRELADVRLADTPESKAWRATVARAARAAAAEQGWQMIERGPVAGSLVAWVPYDDPTTPHAGDQDKHLRQLYDALTDAGIWHDDRQAVGWYVTKQTALDRSGPGYQFWVWVSR